MTEKPRIAWKRLALEFMAIFVAVFLSFLAEDYREYLGDRRDEVRLLRGLKQDLEVDTVFFGIGTIPTDSLASVAGEWLQANWNRSEPPSDSIAWALNGLYRGMAYAPARTEYEAARSSGRLDLIRNAELRRQINTHFEQTHGVLGQVWALNWQFHFAWADAIRPYVEFAPTFPAPIVFATESFKQDLWPNASLAVPWDRVRGNREVAGALAQTNTFRRLALSWQRINLTEIRTLHAAIDAKLGEQ